MMNYVCLYFGMYFINHPLWDTAGLAPTPVKSRGIIFSTRYPIRLTV